MTSPADPPSRSSVRSPLLSRVEALLDRGPGAAAAAAFLLVLTVAALGPTLFNGARVFSNAERDLALQFIHWRKFGFDELRAGHLALWNPHIYGGTPFFGGFQSALLYPPNWLYLCLPLAVAVNTGIALHVFLAGLGMSLWMRVRALHPLATIFAGAAFMFSGPFFPHIYAGHLSNLCTMTWGPFIFLAIDGWLQRRTVGWLFVGAAAVAMQILAGHPQYVFYTGVAAGLYCAVPLAVAKGRLRVAAGLAALALAGVALSAVQVFEGIHAAGESVRNHGTQPGFAAIFSFPPENFLTLLIPNFFGDLTAHAYWGRWFLWEMCLFFSVSGLWMTIYGLAKGPRRQVWSCAGVAAILLVLALGSYTPLFDGLYHHAPGFNRFRGWSKLTYPAVMLLVVVAAHGCDGLLRRGVASSRPGFGALAVGTLLCVAAVWVHSSTRTVSTSAPEPWNTWLHALSATNEQFLAGEQVANPDFVRRAARQASRQMRLAGGTLLTLAAILLAARRHPRAITLVPALAVAELLCFAHTTLDSFRLQDALNPPETGWLTASAREGFRLDNAHNHNLAMSFGAYDLWGYDPGVLRRYAEWMAESQDRDPDEASETMKLVNFPPVMATLLRCRYRIPASGGETQAAEESANAAAPRLFLVAQARVVPDRNEELDDVFAPGFDPVREVVLETVPAPAPMGDTPAGQIKLVGETTDTLTIEADLTASAILLITDTYSDGWQARSLLPTGSNHTSAQSRYQVMPADYCLRAVPLASGHHKILLEYRPAAFVTGKWMSIISIGLYLVAIATWAIVRRRRRAALGVQL